jgi:hypothetical protein
MESMRRARSKGCSLLDAIRIHRMGREQVGGHDADGMVETA